MTKGQVLIASDGLEVALYPLESVRITQTYYGSTSHGSNIVKNTGLWDVTGVNGDTNKGVIYAPFTCKVVVCLTNGKSSGHQVVVQSLNKVHLANGSIGYALFGFGHDNELDVKLGQIIKQGEKLGDCGDYGYVTGVHSHWMIGVGEWTRGNSLPICKNKSGSSIYYMPNAIDIDDMFYINGIREVAKYLNGDKITNNEDGSITYYVSNDKVTCNFKKFSGQTLDLTQFQVERNESKHQVEIKIEIIRARKDHYISDDTLLGIKVPIGIYNVLETYTDKEYKWVKIADGVWFALAGVVNETYIEYEADTTDYKKLYNALNKEFKALQEEFETLRNNYSSLEKDLTNAKEKIESAIKVLK